MGTATPTTTRDILGLALLASLCEQPSDRAQAVDAVRALCLPWLTPTREVISAVLSDHCKAGHLHTRDHRARGDDRPGDQQFEITPDGERELQRLVVHRTGQPPHPLVHLWESLRFSVAHRLEPGAQDEILRRQMRARRCCITMQQRRLVAAGGENSTLAHTLRHQIACAQTEFDVIADGFRPQGGESSAPARCQPVARTEFEPDVPVGEGGAEQGDAIPFLPFSS